MDSITEKRRASIVEQLRRDEVIKVAELSESFGVSEVSIRRDLRRLEDLGALKRVHGGAVLAERTGAARTGTARTGAARPPRSQGDPRAERKVRIAAAAAAMVSPEDRLIIDSGSTPLLVASHLSDELVRAGKLTIITASQPVVRLLGGKRNLQLIVLGGIYLPDYEVTVGPQTIAALDSLHADKMFLGTDGVSLSQGVTTANVLEAEVDRAMVRASTEVIVVADSSKIGAIGLATISPLSSVHKLITDTDAPEDFVERVRQLGIEVILV